MNFSNDDDQYPVASYDEEMEARRRRNRFWIFSGLILAVLMGACVLIYAIVPAEQRYLAVTKFVPFLPTITPTPLFADSGLDYFATATAYPAATSADDFRDEFEASDDTWCEGEEDDNWSSNNLQIRAGEYQWAVTAKRDMFFRCTLDDLTLPDKFYLAVDATATGVENAEAALVYHKTDLGSYYVFDFYPATQAFEVFIYLDEEWIELIPYTISPAINTSGSNRLAVLADGPRYVFFINGDFVGNVEDERLSGGAAGLGISLAEGDSADFVFDNFEVKYP